ncbi:MAG TPA: hypothetical protein VIY48_13280 [Candidatus Paceibacterota bacterium]
MFKKMIDDLSFAETLTDKQKQELLELLEEVDNDAYSAGQGDCDCDCSSEYDEGYDAGYDAGKAECDEAK